MIFSVIEQNAKIIISKEVEISENVAKNQVNVPVAQNLTKTLKVRSDHSENLTNLFCGVKKIFQFGSPDLFSKIV